MEIEKRKRGRPRKNPRPEDLTFHGGFVRDKDGKGIVRPMVPEADELAVPDTETVQETSLAVRKNNYLGTGASPHAARKTKLAVLGIPSEILEAGSPEYARCVRLAQAYKKARTKELFVAHGYVSSGVSALLAAASLALSASRFLYEIAASTEVQPSRRGAIPMPTILKLASSLSDSARQNELSAWELCAREAVIRRRNDANAVQIPWVTTQQPETKRGPGRPRKAAVVASTVEVITHAGFVSGEDEASSNSDVAEGTRPAHDGI